MTSVIDGAAVLELNPAVPAADVLSALGTVIDPELGIDVVNLGMIYRVDCIGMAVRVELTLTTPGCPLHGSIVEEVRRAVLRLGRQLSDAPGLGLLEDAEDGLAVEVQLVWDPPWTPEAMTESAKRALRL